MKKDSRTFQQQAEMFGVLADTTRLHLLKLLDKDEMSVNDLVAAIKCPQPQASHHLSILYRAGFVEKRRQGKQIIYSRTGAMASFLASQT
jgi:DNA-binding transcriptional ArsR family regulator